MRKKMLAGNWKMHGNSQQNVALLEQLVGGLHGLKCDVVVFPPFPYLAQVCAFAGEASLQVGGQNVSERAIGAFTGEVSAAMLADVGCRYVLVGHSERRTLFGESDCVVADKFAIAQAEGLIPVLCLGETLAEREAGVTDVVVLRQLQAIIDRVGVQALSAAILAYEPVWAIGTGLTASPQQVQAVHAGLRAYVGKMDTTVAADLRILYGGSVKPQNAGELFAQADIDGGLVGGASLVADDFLAICQAVV